MAENVGGLVGAAAVGLGVGAADQVAIDTKFGHKYPGTTEWIVGGLAGALGLVGHFSLPKRSRSWRDAADALMVSGLTLVGQVAAHDADRALNRVASASGTPSGATPPTGPTGPLPITTSKSSSTASASGTPNATTPAATSAATSTGAMTYMYAATNYAELP